MENDNRSGDLKDRTYQYALNVASFCNTTAENPYHKDILTKLFQKSSNLALTTRLAFKGRSNAEFRDKLRTIINDSDECIFWFDMLIDLSFVEEESVSDLMTEASELIAIFISISKKSRTNQN
ncbi:MAG: four helix bundle protein [Flavobacteriales bacterium]